MLWRKFMKKITILVYQPYGFLKCILRMVHVLANTQATFLVVYFKTINSSVTPTKTVVQYKRHCLLQNQPIV